MQRINISLEDRIKAKIKISMKAFLKRQCRSQMTLVCNNQILSID